MISGQFPLSAHSQLRANPCALENINTGERRAVFLEVLLSPCFRDRAVLMIELIDEPFGQ